MKFFDAFAGIGGFALALTDLGHECVGFSEIDPHALTVYSSHFPTHHPYGNIASLDPARLPDFDILCGGFPCQSFSVAGKQRGFDDPRGNLFFHLMRIAAAKKPRLLFLENVWGLIHHDEGQTLRRVCEEMDRLGYDVSGQVLNSKYWVCQNRTRIYFVAHLRGTPGPQVFPLGVGCRKTVPEGFEVLAATDDSCQEYYGWDTVNCLVASFTGFPTGKGKPVIRQPDGFIRRFTPLECERLQGYPDAWTAMIPEGERYKCLGNAVTAPVVFDIAKRLR
jgi:DNA (cytosine-5)-methyltransferase 1